jgi:hypothetical protein
MNKLLLMMAALLTAYFAPAQNIGIGTTTPNASAMLDVQSTTKGLLVPRMTAVQRNAINPAANARALMVFDTDSSAFFFWTGTVWSKLGAGGESGTSQWTTSGNSIYYNSIGLVGIGTNNPFAKLHVQSQNQTSILVKSLGTTSNNFASLDVDAGDGDAAVRFLKAGVNNWVFRTDPATDNLEFFEMGQLGQSGSRMIFQNNTGNVGIADANPAAKLSIGGNIKIADGTQGINKVLTSDANGLASWQALPAASNAWAASGSNIFNTNSGFVGIGNTLPAYNLDLSGRLRIRGGANSNFTAGLWLGGFGADSTTNKIFMGMESDSAAGYYSELNGMGWFFVANGRDGRIGIRNRDPKFPLSFDNQAGDKISLFRDGNGSYYGMGIGNSTLQLMTPHSSSSIVFGTGLSGNFTENMRIRGNGLVGIGENNPTIGALVVNKKVGATHAVFGSNSTGVAIESSNPGIGFNNYYDGTRKAIANGYSGYIGVNPNSGGIQFLVSPASNNAGSNVALNTAMLLTADGNVGIGMTDPAYVLDVSGRMRIRGKPGFTAGLWLNNEANTALASFVGMQADNQVGFFGFGSAGWGLLMNTQTGAISVGGNAGQPGQVLTSNGTGAAPSWQGGLGGGKPFVARPSANSADLGTSGRVDMPGMVANFTLNTPALVVFNFKLSITNRGCLACGERRTFIYLVQNIVGGTTDVATTTVYTPNGEIADGVSGPIAMELAAGTYSFKVSLGPSIYGAATVWGRQQEGILTWQIYPN